MWTQVPPSYAVLACHSCQITLRSSDAVQLNSYDASYIAGLLFALHLNVTELAEDGDDSSAMLKCFESESTRLYFEHEARQHVLCVAFVQPCIGVLFLSIFP
jgi:hypothetical protein